MVYLLICAFSVLSSFVLTPPLSEIGLALYCNQPVAVLAMIWIICRDDITQQEILNRLTERSLNAAVYHSPFWYRPLYSKQG